MTTKSEICNMALSRLGDKSTVNDIDNPTTQAEKAFLLWYDTTRRSALERMMPSFARVREVWAKSNFTPAFGYAYAYDYRQDCVRVLGIGNLDEPDNDYVVEGNYIFTNSDYPDGLPVRYVKDVEDATYWSSMFVELFTLMLAYNVAPMLTESTSRLQYLHQTIPQKVAEVIAIGSQENKPFIIKRSRLKNARLGFGYGVKKH